MNNQPKTFPVALANVTGDCFTLDTDSALFKEGVEASRNSPRKRIILPIHRSQEDLVQRMLNFFQLGTYVQPHCHPLDYASETIFIIQGQLGFIVYDDQGIVQSTHRLSQGSMLDIVPRLYHSMVALEPDTVLLEIKRGPYNEDDKTFAEWSAAENSNEAKQALRRNEQLFS